MEILVKKFKLKIIIDTNKKLLKILCLKQKKPLAGSFDQKNAQISQHHNIEEDKWLTLGNGKFKKQLAIVDRKTNEQKIVLAIKEQLCEKK